MNLHEYPSYALLSKALVLGFKRCVSDEEKSFIFSGGSSPKQFLKYLAKEDLDWSKVSLILSDERLVPPNDKRSNFRFIKKNLLERITFKAKPKLLPDMESYCVDSKNYLNNLNHSFIKLPTPRVAFIGVGEDGHYASIFPGQKSPKSQYGYFTVKRPDEDFHRISLSIKNFLSCEQVFVIMHGQGKESILDRLIHSENSDDIPILYFLSLFQGEVNVYTDIKTGS